MNWKKLTIIRILFVIANMLSDDEETSKALTSLANHISVEGKQS